MHEKGEGIIRERTRAGFMTALLGLAVQLAAQQSGRHVVVHAGRLLDAKTGKVLSDQTVIGLL
jgi:hypothetical protein